MLQVRTVNGIAGDEKGGNYTATMVISDAGEGLGIISKVEFFVKLRVNKQVSMSPHTELESRCSQRMATQATKVQSFWLALYL